MRRILLLAASVAVVLTACSSGGPATTDQSAVIYSAVIRAILTDPAQPLTITSDTSVFTSPADPRSPIPLEVQADIVDALHTLATIRFVDQRSEAIDDSTATKPVNDNGVLITLGKIPKPTTTVAVNAERYLDTTNTVTYRVTLKRTATGWKPIAITTKP